MRILVTILVITVALNAQVTLVQMRTLQPPVPIVPIVTSLGGGNVGGTSTMHLKEHLLLFPEQLLPIVAGTGGGSTPPPPTSCTPVSGYSHCAVLTVPHTAITANLTAFPVLAQMTVGSSKFQNSSGYDGVFTSDSGGTTLIPWEMESALFNQSTGAYTAWVPVTLSSTVDTLFYFSYDNASISSAQNTGSLGPTHVWDSNYSLVWHLPNGSTLTALDSTSNGCNGTLQAGSGSNPTAGTGKIDGDAVFIHLSSNNIGDNCGSLPSALTAAQTFSAWYNTDSSAIADQTIGGLWDNTNSKLSELVITPSNLYVNSFLVNMVTTTAPSINAWHYVTAAYDGVSTWSLYVDGAAPVTNASTPQTGVPFGTGVSDSLGFGFGFDGGIDEWRVSKIARSTAWVTAEYNNQKTSPTFPTVTYH